MKTILIACAIIAAVAFGWPLIDQDTSDECVAADQKITRRTAEAGSAGAGRAGTQFSSRGTRGGDGGRCF